MGSCNHIGKYSDREAARNIDELLLIALAVGVLILIAACMGFAGSLLLLALVAIFFGVVQTILRCRVLNLLHLVLLGFIVFSVIAGVPVASIVISGAATYLVLVGTVKLLDQICFERYAKR